VTLTTISVVSTKGGVGKTTLAANLGGILADLKLRVLLIDADVQPSLSKYYQIATQATHGLHAVITRGGSISFDCVSKTTIPGLDIILSDAPDGYLQTWLKDREDRLVILKRALKSPFVRDNYDVVLIDTQGAVGELQKTAAMAADLMISPINPSILSAREFASGTISMLESLNRMADMSAEFRSGDLYALIYAQDQTNDARTIADLIRQDFRSSNRVRVMESIVPHSTVYRAAATSQVPVHRLDQRTKFNSYEVMHSLVWELFPNLKGTYVGEAAVQSAPEEIKSGE
jgi:chromosome partitioning related protein ParA